MMVYMTGECPCTLEKSELWVSSWEDSVMETGSLHVCSFTLSWPPELPASLAVSLWSTSSPIRHKQIQSFNSLKLPSAGSLLSYSF